LGGGAKLGGAGRGANAGGETDTDETISVSAGVVFFRAKPL
jgi:hypothetical protein